MSMMNDGGDRGIAPPKPLFESSWLALFVLLKQELDSLRRDGAEPEAPDCGEDLRRPPPERNN